MERLIQKKKKKALVLLILAKCFYVEKNGEINIVVQVASTGGGNF